MRGGLVDRAGRQRRAEPPRGHDPARWCRGLAPQRGRRRGVEGIELGDAGPRPRRARRLARRIDERRQPARRLDVGVVPREQPFERVDGARGVAAARRQIGDARRAGCRCPPATAAGRRRAPTPRKRRPAPRRRRRAASPSRICRSTLPGYSAASASIVSRGVRAVSADVLRAAPGREHGGEALGHGRRQTRAQSRRASARRPAASPRRPTRHRQTRAPAPAAHGSPRVIDQVVDQQRRLVVRQRDGLARHEAAIEIRQRG